MRPWWAITLLFVAGLPGCSTLKPPAELDSVGRRALRAIEAADSAALGQLADESLPTPAADDDYRADCPDPLCLGARQRRARRLDRQRHRANSRCSAHLRAPRPSGLGRHVT